MTPSKYQHISKRNWEGQMKAWRRRLHEFDPPNVKHDGRDAYIAPRDPRVDDKIVELEEGELAFWMEEDEAWYKRHGGRVKYEARMLKRMQEQLELENAADTVADREDGEKASAGEQVMDNGKDVIVEVVETVLASDALNDGKLSTAVEGESVQV
jgi:hypothetical protein